MFRSCLFRLLSVPLYMLALFGAYEGVAVWRAQQRTPAILASVADRPLKLADLPEGRRAALIAVEDPGFYSHHGLDFFTPGAGLTSIAQALVRRLYFDEFSPGFATIEQSLIARFAFDAAVPKDEQLEIFLNQASFGAPDGRPVIGFPAAARTFYGRDVADLSEREYLSLVAMLITPDTLDPNEHAAANEQRVRRIEALLAGRCAPAHLFDVQYGTCHGL
ncbi:MAG: glycosyl transferase family 51 [Sphingomonadales bacterium]|nr:MAG: glycosyl transferase family 51 [Sphingomonadales bacterium]